MTDPTELVRGLDDHTLAVLAAAAADEQRRRARDDDDPEQAARAGFDRDFDPSGTAKDPRIDGRFLICPGSLNGAAAGSHDCVFVHVADSDDTDDGAWVFEHPDRIVDIVRHADIHGRAVQQSITVLAAVEGLHVERIGSRSRNGRHERRTLTAWRIHHGRLERTQPRGRVTTNSR